MGHLNAEGGLVAPAPVVRIGLGFLSYELRSILALVRDP